MNKPTLLILGGTSLAINFTNQVAKIDARVIYSLAGRTSPKSLPDQETIETRSGGFGGQIALTDYLIREHVDVVIDATHAYAAQISKNAQTACKEAGLPIINLQEAPWQQEEGDNWINVLDLAAAREQASKIAERVFVSTGRQGAGEFKDNTRCWWLIRVIPTDDVLPTLAHGDYVFERGPFDLQNELSMLKDQKIEAVISKNAGSKATYAKITAARELALPVIMIDRPESGEVLQVDTVTAALDWLKQQIA